MAVLKKIKRAVRGEVKLTTVALEALRRSRVSFQQRKERANLDIKQALSLAPSYARMNADELLSHFQGTRDARFAELQQKLFPSETADLIASANRIVDDHCWLLLGFGEKCFGEEIQWRRDPLSNYVWPLDYHRDIKLMRDDGSDVRVLWELNRLGHFLTLACAYSTTKDKCYSAAFFFAVAKLGGAESVWSRRQLELRNGARTPRHQPPGFLRNISSLSAAQF